MSKKLSLAKKGKSTGTMDGDPPMTKIKETLVGDPSINFTVALDRGLLEPHEVDGYNVIDFRVEVWLALITPAPNEFERIADIRVKSLSMYDPYFYVSFGDPRYTAGQEFLMRLKLKGKYPDTLKDIKFNDDDNWFEQHLMGGGILSGNTGKSKKRKK